METTLEAINDALEDYRSILNFADIKEARLIRKEMQELKDEKHKLQKSLKKENIRA